MDSSISYWVEHSDSFLHQIFMIVMGGLYALAFVAGVTYKTMNIYCYFIFYPASFVLFLKSPKKYLVLLATFLFFLIPNIEAKSATFFDQCVVFLNYSAGLFGSNYTNMSVYLCVVIPLLLYLPFTIKRFDMKTLKYVGASLLVLGLLYFVIIYPNFKKGIQFLMEAYPQKV
jgi:hypothetical protein